ncbi:MAG TPA: DUF1707 domain-containing protein, partial [Streptosporangiaceae bacterium]|nr:DUF1707 domain-containing protein [Streptosporangiaceae bacterium]
MPRNNCWNAPGAGCTRSWPATSTASTTNSRGARQAMDDRIRVSDADRDRVAARLRDHFAEGRLTQDELDERISAALA